MNSTIMTTTLLPHETADYSIVIPISLAIAILAVILSIIILLLIGCHRRLHTVTHLLIANTCLWSIFYCVAQSNHFIYLLLITWDTSDISCRWRGYFAYMTIAGVNYSYLIQAISRLFFIVLATKHRSLLSFKVHFILIGIQWVIAILVVLPAILTKDIYFRSHSLCWVNPSYILHTYYTFVTYYAIPSILIISIYTYVYYRIRLSSARILERTGGRQQQIRDFKIFRNLIILLGLYLSGGIPTTIYIFTFISIFYLIGIVFISLSMAIEKVATFCLDRELLNALKILIRQRNIRVAATVV